MRNFGNYGQLRRKCLDSVPWPGGTSGLCRSIRFRYIFAFMDIVLAARGWACGARSIVDVRLGRCSTGVLKACAMGKRPKLFRDPVHDQIRYDGTDLATHPVSNPNERLSWL